MKGDHVLVAILLGVAAGALALGVIVHLLFVVRRRFQRKVVALAEAPPPPPGPHNCAHQRGGHLRCAVPSCPDGVSGKTYKVKLIGAPPRTLVRVRLSTGWTWATKEAVDAAQRA